MTADSAQTLKTAQALFVVHSASVWDSNLSTQKNVQEMIQSALSLNQSAGSEKLPVLMFLDNMRNRSHYFWQDPKGIRFVESIAGQHAIRLEGTKVLYMAGGVFEYCLCRAVRDVLTNADFSQEASLEISFVEEAIYINNGYTDPRWSNGSASTMTLRQFTDRMSDAQFYDYIIGRYFGDRSAGICTQLNDRLLPGASLPDRFHFEVQRQGRLIGSFGNSAGTPIQLNFIGLDEYFKATSR